MEHQRTIDGGCEVLEWHDPPRCERDGPRNRIRRCAVKHHTENAVIDTELLVILKAVRDGNITDTDRARTIISEAQSAIQHEYRMYREAEDLLDAATNAFVRGWTAQPS